MSSDQLTAEALALPLPQRIELAQALWDSIDECAEEAEDGESAAAALAVLRDEEMESGNVSHLSHEKVMDAARKALE